MYVRTEQMRHACAVCVRGWLKLLRTYVREPRLLNHMAHSWLLSLPSSLGPKCFIFLLRGSASSRWMS